MLEKLARPALPRISLYSDDRRLLAHAGAPLLPPPPDARDNDWLHRHGHDSAWVLHLPDGRWLLAQPQHNPPPMPFPFIMMLVLIGLVVAVVAYPMTRRMTRRLEGLKQAVEALGEQANEALALHGQEVAGLHAQQHGQVWHMAGHRAFGAQLADPAVLRGPHRHAARRRPEWAPASRR